MKLEEQTIKEIKDRKWPHSFLSWAIGIITPLFFIASCILPESSRTIQRPSLETPPAHLDVTYVGGEEETDMDAPADREDRTVSIIEDGTVLGGSPPSDAPTLAGLRKEDQYAQIAFQAAAAKAKEWGLKQPEKELSLHSIRTDELGMTHVALQQMHRHVPVWNRGVVVHLNPSGQVQQMKASVIPTPQGLTDPPKIGPGDAMAAVGKVLPGDAECANCQAENVIFASKNGPRTAYRVVAFIDAAKRRVFFVDGTTSDILKEQ